MVIPEFKSRESLNKLWWLHDSLWHSTLVRELGAARANQVNLEVSERIFRMMTVVLFRKKLIKKPRSIQELMHVFKTVWKNAFFDELYVHEPISYEGNTAIWTGARCHVYDSLKRANMLDSYECGCQALRDGVMKALRLEPVHLIKESLVRGDGRCVIQITFRPTP